MKQFVILTILFFSLGILRCSAQTDTLQARIILIGDAGQLTNGRQYVVSAVKKYVPMNKKTTIIFLGDNLYKVGLPDYQMPTYAQARAVLDTQINIAEGTDAKVYFIPGNHDWNNGSKNGWEAVIRQQQYIDALASDKLNVDFEPKDGCPGPIAKSITPDVELIMMDSQWWVHQSDKPGIESDCPSKTKQELLDELDALLAANSGKLVIFACHHTFKSRGIHGGYFTLKQYIFPFTDAFPTFGYYLLPLSPPPLGIIYPITRSVFGTAEDLSHPAYAEMIDKVTKVIKRYPNVIFAAGHEHTLQLIKDSSYYYIVSGSGSKSSRVSKSRQTMFASSLNGFATLEISKNKNVSTTFYTVQGEKVKDTSFKLLNFTTIEQATPKDSAAVEYTFKDSAVAAASSKYQKASAFKKLFLGKNYRDEWSTPIHLKVFNIRKQNGGFKILSQGGGRQTRSLRLADKTGKEWTIRSIDKDPKKAIPENLQGTLAESIVQDMISASHPYSSLAVPDLAKAIDVRVATPKFFIIPDDPAFGIYRQQFANTICLLEERDPSYDATDTKSTMKIFAKVTDDNDNHAEQQTFLRARLLDMMIGDWDRHYDQWKWGIFDTGKGKLYYPIPRDRDQAFFNSDGLLLSYITLSQLRYLQGFKRNFPSLKWLNWEARDLDRFFLNNLDKKQWEQTLADFKNTMSDSLLTAAVKKMPSEIFAKKGEAIIKKLESRRDLLMTEGLKYYRYISKRVNIVGSNKKEYFKLTGTPEGTEVKVYKRTKRLDTTTLIYDRVFDNSTKEIRLYGLKGDDYFDIDNSVHSKIKVRMIGGTGNDTFNIRGNIRNYVYDITSDTSTDKNWIVNKSRTKLRFSPHPSVHQYSPTGFIYNEYRFPRIHIGYNPDDKLFFGLGFLARTHGGFRKDPFSTEQKLSTLYSFNNGAYQFKYNAVFNQVMFHNKYDVLFNAEMVNPVLNNFYGLGNETKFVNGEEFYRVRYKYVQGDILVRKRLFNDILSISIGPTAYNYWNKYIDNQNRILAHPANIGLDSTSIYNKKTYVGGKFKIDVNYLDNELFPTRGIIWNTEATGLLGINNNSRNLGKFTTDMGVYANLIRPAKLIAVLHVGFGHIFSKNPEYFQTITLGANNFMRGFRKNRFSGTSMLYASLEGRIKLLRSTSYIFPGDFGVVVYDDFGRVWQRGEKSKVWHNSYGGGFYYAPFNLVIVSATMGFSKEDQLFNFSLGTKFNLSF